MERIFITGDTHNKQEEEGLEKLRHFIIENEWHIHPPEEEIFIIILGDFGYIFDGLCSINKKLYPSIQEEVMLTYIESFKKYNITVCFVPGNHENYNRLESQEFPIVDFKGSKAKKIRDNIYCLMRGEIYSIADKTLFTFGGAKSLDKHSRIENQSWWAHELPTQEEIDYAFDNLSKHNNKVDYILTHCTSTSIEPFFSSQSRNHWTDALDLIYEKVSFQSAFFGHYHEDSIYSFGDKTYGCVLFDFIEL